MWTGAPRHLVNFSAVPSSAVQWHSFVPVDYFSPWFELCFSGRSDPAGFGNSKSIIVVRCRGTLHCGRFRTTTLSNTRLTSAGSFEHERQQRIIHFGNVQINAAPQKTLTRHGSQRGSTHRVIWNYSLELLICDQDWTTTYTEPFKRLWCYIHSKIKKRTQARKPKQ